MHPICLPRLGCALILTLFWQSTSANCWAGSIPDKVDFERHVMGLLGRLGCNAGSCHGSFQGRGGLRLSLFGYDPQRDFLALTRDLEGRRVNRSDPDSSLVLLKPSGRIPHGGYKRFDIHSWQYALLRRWIGPRRGTRQSPRPSRPASRRRRPRIVRPFHARRLVMGAHNDDTLCVEGSRARRRATCGTW